jgi:phage gpG-like protein
MDDLTNKLTLAIQGVVNKDFTPALTVVAALIRAYIDQNFMQHGRWNGRGTGLSDGGKERWTPLAPSTIKSYQRKGYALEPTLIRATQQLYNSIEVNVKGKNKIVISVGSIYGAAHQFGATIHTKKATIKIPPRPFITLTQDDINEILTYLRKFMLS